jgi:hypothetical protein
MLDCFAMNADGVSITAAPKVRVDGNLTGLAGEFFVAAELMKRGLQVSITFGNTKHIDLFAHNPTTKRDFTVQVKALRAKGCFPISKIHESHIYVFVVLNKPGKPVDYFIATGKELLADPVKYAYEDPKMSGIYSSTLAELIGRWHLFDALPS